MSDEVAIRVNFGRPMPVFPLHAVTLMPHALLHLHIFEPRYRQMVTDALDGPGQIAMAIFKGDHWRQTYHGRPALREAMCVGQIVAHEQMADGRFNLALHGVCRARLVSELPADEERLYRSALLEPIAVEETDNDALKPTRLNLIRLLAKSSLHDLKHASDIVAHLRDQDVPTSAVLELVTILILENDELRYQLLEEPDVQCRANLVLDQLRSLQRLLDRAAPQRLGLTEKGCSWN